MLRFFSRRSVSKLPFMHANVYMCTCAILMACLFVCLYCARQELGTKRGKIFGACSTKSRRETAKPSGGLRQSTERTGMSLWQPIPSGRSHQRWCGIKREAGDSYPPSTWAFVNSRTLLRCSTPATHDGVSRVPWQCPLGVGGTLPL